MVKLSKYNNYFLNSQKEILVYNSFVGSSSLCKLSYERYGKWFEDKSKFCDETEIANELIYKGIFVDENLDESQLVEYENLKNKFNNTLSLIILPTEQCNFRCTYCYEDYMKGKMSKEVVKDVSSYVERNINKYSSLSTSWFGGEPLCALDIIQNLSDKFIQSSKKFGKPYISTITTNGYLLTPDIMRKLIQMHILGYQITLDGGQKCHDQNRKLVSGHGTYCKIVENLKRIQSVIKTNTFQIAIRSNFNTDSIEYIDEYLEMLKENFNDDKRFSISFRMVRNLKNESSPDRIIDDDRYMSELYKKAEQYIPDMLENHFISLLNRDGKCYAANENSYCIGADGLVYKCTVHFDEEINKLGYIDSGGMHIDKQKNARWVLAQTDDSFNCKNCEFDGKCFRGTCPYQCIKNNKKKASCPMEKENLEYILSFLDKRNKLQLY